MTSHAKDGWRGDSSGSESGDPLPPPPHTAPDDTGDPHRSADEHPAVSEFADTEPFFDEYPEGDRAASPGFGGLGGPAPSSEGGSGSGSGSEVEQYREALMRVKADFDNYKKRVAKDHAATVERAAEKLVADLLPVLDACEAALNQGADDVDPIYKSLCDILEKGGLRRMSPNGQPFDPNLHEAVIHEPGDGDHTIVVDSLRTGYLWNGRVVRAAMVKVQG